MYTEQFGKHSKQHSSKTTATTIDSSSTFGKHSKQHSSKTTNIFA